MATQILPTIHFNRAGTGNGTDHININLVGLPQNLLQPDDEIAVIDGKLCVGAVTFQEQYLSEGIVSVPVTATDEKVIRVLSKAILSS